MSGPSGAVRSLTGLAGGLCRAWWRQLAAVTAACAVVTTAIVGSLGVGAGIESGLRRLALARLGRIEAAVVADAPFGDALVGDLARTAAQGGPGAPAVLVPALVLEVTVATADRPRAALRATLLACDDPAALGFSPSPPPQSGGLLVNAPLARALAAQPGGTAVVRMAEPAAVPGDSPLGRRDSRSIGRRLRIDGILENDGLGRFSLAPGQSTRPLAVVPLDFARDMLRDDQAVNVVLAVGGDAEWLHAHLRPRLADYGLSLAPTTADDPSLRLTSRRLILPPEVDRAAAELLAPLGGRPSLVFLANAIEPTGRHGPEARARVPYSTVIGVDAAELPVGDLVAEDGSPLAAPSGDEIVIDRWVADDLAAQGRPVGVGDRLVLTFFRPETVQGRVEEATATFRVAGIAAMRGAAVARQLVPEVEGVTDEASIADWDPPFPFEPQRVRTTPPHDEDDRFWKAHGATPKAFVSLAAARRLAGSRFGDSTAWHLPRAGVDTADLAARLAASIEPTAAGIRVLPLRREALAAARGSTPFGGLFLALSSFVLVAGLILAWLLFNLLTVARRREIGLLGAVGWPPGRITRLLLAVAAVAALVGGAIGWLAGPAWTRLLLAALARSWQADVVGGAVDVFAAARVPWRSLWPGVAAAVVATLSSVAWAARRAARLPPARALAAADDTTAVTVNPATRGRLAGAALAGLAVAAGLAGAAHGAAPGAAVGLFLGGGFAVLGSLLALARLLLSPSRTPTAIRSLGGLAARSLAAQPGRGFAVAAIVAAGQFLVVAVSSFAVRLPARPDDPRSPTGGWTTIASFGSPTSINPADPALRGGLGLTEPQEQALAASTITMLRSNAGDDASCTNLYAARRPKVVGVGADFRNRGGFRFVARAEATPATDARVVANPWLLLERDAGRVEPAVIPVVVDQATAQWGLKLGGVGDRFTLATETGPPATLEIVGLLEPGILQGVLLVAEHDFNRLFPSVSGWSLALVDATGVPAPRLGDLDDGLAAAWADAAVTLEPAARRLRGLQAVQNTFLAGFQALGTLGLLLGTAGVAAVQAQAVMERRGALALLRAIGFTPARVRRLVVLETLAMAGLGLVAGTTAGLVAVIPQLATGAARLPAWWIAATAAVTLAAACGAGGLATARGAIPTRPTVS